jgi:hypothetical protein
VNLRPYTVARYGIYGALAFAALSVWLGQRAGASLDYTILRGVFIFIVFTGLAFGADAVLTLGVRLAPPEPPVQPAIQREQSDD